MMAAMPCTTPSKIVVAGAAGRMGRMLTQAIAARSDAALHGAVGRLGDPRLGEDVGVLAGGPAIGVALSADPEPTFEGADVVIDFTTPDAAVRHGMVAAACGAALVIGVTGLGVAQEDALRQVARRVPVVLAANFSIGVAVLTALTRQVAATLDPSWDAEILDFHHRRKVDAPSGTALALGRAVAAGRGIDAAAQRRSVCDSCTGPREVGVIGYATLRGGDVIGEHTVVFAGDDERIELTHRAGSRRIFAVGAVRAAMWTRRRSPGLYGMEDVLGFGT